MGVRVLELPGLASSFCGFVLRQHGADVTRIEPLGGDPLALRDPLVDTQAGPVSAAYLAYNRGKTVIELDRDAERAELNRLIAGADIVIQYVEPGTAAPLDPEAIREFAPAVILTSISVFGLTGPYAGWHGSDLIASAMSGLLHLTGVPGEEPVRMGAEQAVKLGGAEAAAGTMVALHARELSGRGQHVDTAIRDAVIRANVNAIPKYEYEGAIQQRVGDHWGVRDKPLRALWRCSDGWVSFVRRGGALGSRVNPSCVEWMGLHGLDVSEFDGVDWSAMDMGNPEHRVTIDRLDELFAEFLAEQSTEYAFREGLRRGMTLAPVKTVAELLEDDHLAARDYWDTLQLGDVEYRLPGRFVNAGAREPQRLDAPAREPRLDAIDA